MEESREEFRKRLLKVGIPHEFEVRNSRGIRDAWKWLRKNKWSLIGQPVSENDFREIVKTINQFLQDQLLDGKDVKLPCGMGIIEVRKKKNKLVSTGSKILAGYPIDWKRTIDLWYEDAESRDKKTLVRRESSERFLILYNKRKSYYFHSSFYKFIPSRPLRHKLKEKIINGAFDALLLKKDDEVH